MSEIYTHDVVFFFGAGASAPFGIPTMKEFVVDFEKSLDQSDDTNAKKEKEIYIDIKESLEKKLSKPVDLEAIFTVIDGILEYTPERLGLLSLYLTVGFKQDFPDRFDLETCKSLRKRFQSFVKDQCVIPKDSFERIGLVYYDLFNRFTLELMSSSDAAWSGKYRWSNRWAIFTTNYDLCLEYYWREVAGARIDTGFEFDETRHVSCLRPYRLLRDDIGLQLLKLHGSVDWLVESRNGQIIEVEMVKGHSHMGRIFAGEMMLYPIAEKQLYLDPYVSMLLRLNRELERKSTWIVIGYSFNDPVIREIFLRNSDEGKRLILVHPNADSINKEKLEEFKGKESLLNERFGLKETFRYINGHMIIELKGNLKYQLDETPVSQ